MKQAAETAAVPKTATYGMGPDKGQYQTPFSSLTTAANLLLKVKCRLEADDKTADLKNKESFDLAACLSLFARFILAVEYEIDMFKKDPAEKPPRTFKDLTFLLQSPHFYVFLQSLLDYFKVYASH